MRPPLMKEALSGAAAALQDRLNLGLLRFAHMVRDHLVRLATESDT